MIRGGAFYGQPKPTLSYPPEIIVRHCNGPAGASHRSKTMGLIVLLVVFILLFGGGGFYYGPPYHYYGGGLGLLLLIVVLILLFRSRA